MYMTFLTRHFIYLFEEKKINNSKKEKEEQEEKKIENEKDENVFFLTTHSNQIATLSDLQIHIK